MGTYFIVPEGIMPDDGKGRTVPVANLRPNSTMRVFVCIKLQNCDIDAIVHDETTFVRENILKLELPNSKMNLSCADKTWTALCTAANGEMGTLVGNGNPKLYALLGLKLVTSLTGAIRPKRRSAGKIDLMYWPANCYIADPLCATKPTSTPHQLEKSCRYDFFFT